MDVTTYKEALSQARKDLARANENLALAQEQAIEAERDIAELRQTIAALATLCGQSEIIEENALGLTDAVRQTLRTVSGPLTAQGLRDRMEGMGYGNRWANLIASVNTVLRRLEKMGEVRQCGKVGDKPAYTYVKAAKDLKALYDSGMRGNEKPK